MDSNYVDGQQRRINELQTRCQRLEQLFRDKTTAENANQQLRNSLESQIQFLQEENVRLTNETSNQQKVDQCYECVKQGNNAIKPHINECIRIRNGGLGGFTVKELLEVVDKCYESAVAKMSDCESIKQNGLIGFTVKELLEVYDKCKKVAYDHDEV